MGDRSADQALLAGVYANGYSRNRTGRGAHRACIQVKRYTPIGVVGAITPWNLPVIISFMKVPLLQAEHELYQFQIKTTTTNEYRSSMPIRKVHELWHKVINLVVVFWANEKTPSVIVLLHLLFECWPPVASKNPKAPLIMTGDFVSLRFIERNGRYFSRNPRPRNNGYASTCSLRARSTGSRSCTRSGKRTISV